MSARKTALSCTVYSLDAQDYLGELQVFGLEIGATEAESQGLGATSAYTQVTKRQATHKFELMKDNSGPKLCNLDVSVWTPDSVALVGDLKSGNVRLTVPQADGSGLADVFTYANIVGARRIEVATEAMILSSSSVVAALTDARSATVEDWNMATVLLTLGTGMVFSLPMVLGAVDHTFQRDGLQMYKANYKLKGAPSTVPTAITLYSVAFSGDGLITLAATTGAGAWSGTGVVTSLDIAFSDGQINKVTGELAMQGQPGYS